MFPDARRSFARVGTAKPPTPPPRTSKEPGCLGHVSFCLPDSNPRLQTCLSLPHPEGKQPGGSQQTSKHETRQDADTARHLGASVISQLQASAGCCYLSVSCPREPLLVQHASPPLRKSGQPSLLAAIRTVERRGHVCMPFTWGCRTDSTLGVVAGVTKARLRRVYCRVTLGHFWAGKEARVSHSLAFP